MLLLFLLMCKMSEYLQNLYINKMYLYYLHWNKKKNKIAASTSFIYHCPTI